MTTGEIPDGWSLLYVNHNPNPNTICSLCKPWIGHHFTPGNEIPLPQHPNCYCAYETVWLPEPPTPIDWPAHFRQLKTSDPATYRRWVQKAAWFLRIGFALGTMATLRSDARRYNDEEYDPDDDEPDPPDHNATRRTIMPLTHNSTTADSEPQWSNVDKSKLPNNAFASMDDDRKYPHHWVKGGETNDDGRYTSGTMYLHKGGLNAAWAAAQGARSGQQASTTIKAHLQAHRKALGLDKDDQAPERTFYDAPQTPQDPQGRDPSDTSAKHPFPFDSGTQKASLQAGYLWDDHQPDSPRTYSATLISAGYVQQEDGSDSNIFIPAHVLQDAAHLFQAVPHYVDHPDLFGFGWRQRPSIRDLAGVVDQVQFDPFTDSVIGTIRLYDTEAGRLLGALYDQILADAAAGEAVPPLGLSAVLFREYETDEDTGQQNYTRIHKVSSVDAVYEPGAAGYIRQALSTIRSEPTQEGGTMPEVTQETHDVPLEETPTEVSEPTDVVASPAPDDPSGEIARIHANVATIQKTVANLTAAFGDLSQIVTNQEEQRTIQDMGDAPRAPDALYGGFTGLDRVEMAVDALLSGTRPPNGVRPLTGIRELYMLLSGDYELTGRYHPDRVYLANVTTSTMAGLVANRLNKIVINMFQEYDQWWAPGATVKDFNSLQDVRWITLGGVGELPTVAEGAAYSEMTWDDQTETDTFVKKGGYLGITLETIDKDDTGRVMAAPRALAQAAWLTLGKAIAEVFTANSGYGPSMSDSNYLFDSSNHSNEGSTALSFSAWETTKIAMMKYTEVNSGERLGALTRPRLLWVPIDLENTAIEILAAGEGHINDADYHVNAEASATDMMARLNNARRRVVTVPFWTDTNDWVAQADPNMYPGLGLAFRYGRTPEIFSVADPRAGLMFTNDTMPIKVRFFFAVGPTDWRAWYKHIVT